MNLQENVHSDENKAFMNRLEQVGWFMFDLLLLRYVEDQKSSLSFCLLHDREYRIYIEVSTRSTDCFFKP